MAWQQKRAHAGSTGRMWCSRKWLHTVLECIRCNPGMVRAITLAVWKRLRKCVTLMYWSCLCDVTRGCPDRGLSLPLPVVCKRLQRQLMVFRCTPNQRAISRWGVPVWIIPMARWRASIPKRGMLCAHRQWSPINKCVFSGTSKHSQHPFMLTRCETRMTEGTTL